MSDRPTILVLTVGGAPASAEELQDATGDQVRVVHCATAYRASQLIARERPDLVLIDHALWAGDGDELAADIERRPELEGVRVWVWAAQAGEGVDYSRDQLPRLAIAIGQLAMRDQPPSLHAIRVDLDRMQGSQRRAWRKIDELGERLAELEVVQLANQQLLEDIKALLQRPSFARELLHLVRDCGRGTYTELRGFAGDVLSLLKAHPKLAVAVLILAGVLALSWGTVTDRFDATLNGIGSLNYRAQSNRSVDTDEAQVEDDSEWVRPLAPEVVPAP